MAGPPPGAVFVTTKELSDWLRVPVETLRYRRRRGYGPPYYRLESEGDKATIRYAVAEVRDYLKSLRIDPARRLIA